MNMSLSLKVFCYVDGLDEAVAFYQKVFDAEIGENAKYPDGTYEWCEIRIGNGESFYLAERQGEWAVEGAVNTGNIMQACLRYKEKDLPKLEEAYERIIEGANIFYPLGPGGDATSHTCDLIDKYGLRWCLMIW